MYYPPPRRGSNSTGVIILLVVAVMCCMFVMPALGFGAWTLFKKDDKDETSDDTDETSVPQLTFDQDATKTINENENTEPADETDDTDETAQVDDSTTSTYKIEYAGGGDGSDAIDLTLSWTNGTGFDRVDKLIFVRSVNGKELQRETTTDETETSNDGKGSVTFKGTNIADDVASAVGTNKVEVFAYEEDGTSITGGGVGIASVTIPISQDDLDQTYEGPYGDLTIPVTLSAGSMDLKKFIKKTYYSISHAPEYWCEIEKSGDNVKFKRKSGMYLSIGGVDVFRLQKYKGRLVIMNTATDKIYVPGRGMRVKTEMTSEEYWLAQCDLIGASLIVGNEEGSVRQGVDFVSPNKQFFAIYQKSDGNFAVYKGSGSSDNKGVMWLSGTNDIIKDGQIVMRPRYNNETYAALSFSSTKDLAGGNIKKEMVSTNTGVKPYKLLISDVGRLVVTDSNGQNMVMKNNFPTTYTDYDLQYFFQSTHGSVCGTDLPHSSNGGGNNAEKQQVCAKKCYEMDGCIGYVMNDDTCFFKKANFLNTGTHTSQGCINAHKKTRLNNTDKYDHTGFKYRAGRCDTVPIPGGMPMQTYLGIVGQCPGKLTPEACVRSKLCAWNPVNSSKKYSSYHTNDGISAPGTITNFAN